MISSQHKGHLTQGEKTNQENFSAALAVAVEKEL